MEINGLVGGLYRIAEWIMRLAYANLLWILFTIMGLVVLGGIPSTIGLFAVVRKWVMGETDIPIFKTYWKAFSNEFVKGNLLGYILLGIGYVIYVDFKYFQSQQGIIFIILSFLMIFLFLVYFLTLLYFFPVFVHFELRKFQYLKQPLFIMLLQPIGAILMALGTLAVYFLMSYIPGLIPFFAASLMAYVLMWIAYRVFLRVEKKVQSS
ncbi:putative membrane protein YesL [Scopulibacillus darangshiensis]|uniref:Putative membrane protein YesL n=1 Tax=Scopulibacillus darangshiensis TaxID=442528 RepID=A0A4R2NJN1_9BACL|nr:YesL family protein [Scopulibacillus darangshiensis]TCP21334.1 putative membrane protein YesL [Scopulibacillus darangshiensis]